MAGKAKASLWQFVLGLGSLSGVRTSIGIDPEEAILNAAGTAVILAYPDP